MFEPKLLDGLDRIMRMVISHEPEEDIVGAICDLKGDIRYENRSAVPRINSQPPHLSDWVPWNHGKLVVGRKEYPSGKKN